MNIKDNSLIIKTFREINNRFVKNSIVYKFFDYIQKTLSSFFENSAFIKYIFKTNNWESGPLEGSATLKKLGLTKGFFSLFIPESAKIIAGSKRAELLVILTFSLFAIATYSILFYFIK